MAVQNRKKDMEKKVIYLNTVVSSPCCLPKTEYMEDLGKSIKNRELEFWELIKTELEALK